MTDDEAPSGSVNTPGTTPERAPGTAAVETAEAPAHDSGLRRTWIIVGIAVVVIVVAVAGGVALGHHGSSKSAALTLEGAASAGESPFTDSVAVGKPTTFPKDVQAAIAKARARLLRNDKTGTLTVTGTTPGVYAGTGATAVCNAPALAAYLAKNPGNATNWAKAAGIQRNGIGRFVSSLTPVLLTYDARVTNHAYDNATIAPRQSVLQAGTPVLIDPYGSPRVACKSGNPLTATRPVVITKTRGSAWPGFDVKNVVTISNGARTATFKLLDAQTGKIYDVPAGNGATAGPTTGTAQWVIAEPNFAGYNITSTSIIAISLYSPWKVLSVIPGEGVRGLAWGDGKWVAVTNASNGGEGNHVLVSTDLKKWKQVAALPNRLSAVAYGDGRWTATALHLAPAADSTETYRTQRVIYSSTDAVHWTQVAVVGDISKHSPWAIGRGPAAYGPVAYGNGEWLTSVASGDDPGGTGIPPVELFTSKDGQHWTANGTKFAGQISTALAFSNGTWALGAVPAASGNATVSTSKNGTKWTSSDKGLLRGGVAALAAGSGGWFAVIVTASSAGPVSTFVRSADAKTWTTVGTVHEFVWALTYGGPGSESSTSPTTTTQPTTSTGNAPTSSTGGASTTTTAASSVRAPQ